MALTQKSLETLKEEYATLFSVSTTDEKIAHYNNWAETYDQDTALQGYRGPSCTAKSVSSHFSGDREAAVVLDVACGTGQVVEKMKKDGFRRFVGIDGSKAMLEKAQKKGLYQELKQCILGEKPLPVESGSVDVVVICGALGTEHVSISVVRELCNVCKPGGYVCMTSRHSPDNLEYKADLERELKQMEDEGLWICVAVTEVENWVKGVSAAHGDNYSSGFVYLYNKL